MDVIQFDIEEAKDAVRSVPVHSETVYKALVAAARALLVTFGFEPKKDREIFVLFRRHLIEPGWVRSEIQQALDQALDWRMGDTESIEDLLPETQGLVNRIEELYLSLDAALKFRAAPAAPKTANETGGLKNPCIDLRGVKCPLNFVKAKIEIEKLKIGDILEVLLDEGEPARNVPASFAEQGQEILETEKADGSCRVKICRKK